MVGPIVTNLQGPSPELALPSRIVAAARRAAGRVLRLGTPARRLELALPKARAWSARVGRGGAAFLCIAGPVWLTREGDPEDRVLEGGSTFRSERRGRVALLALGPARVAVVGDFDAARALPGDNGE
jgi:hypothetical protein